MKLHKLLAEQVLPISLKEAWGFMSSPKNLSTITPDYMRFRITSGYEEDKMYKGMIISYKVSPVLNVDLNWITEITHVEEERFFVDEQRFGPYKFWHHKHFLEENSDGVKMTDIVHYMLPFGILGNIANSLFVKNQLQEIFTYRYRKLEEIYGQVNNEPETSPSISLTSLH